MNNDQTKTHGIAPGFGERLKNERNRLNYSQGELADIGGVGRLTQLQYESEKTFPTTKYLNSVSLVGVNLIYLLFNYDKQAASVLEMQDIDEKVLNLVSRAIESYPDKKVTAETFSLLFKITKNMMIEKARGEISAEFDILSMISKTAA